MKPIYQTIKGEDGNCWAACLASILEWDLSVMPQGFRYHDEWQDWALGHGFLIKTRPVGDKHPMPSGLLIVDAESPRGFARGHAVVVQDGAIVHDPYEGGEPVTGAWRYWSQVVPLADR